MSARKNEYEEDLSPYFREIRKIPLLSYDEERELALKSREGDEKARQRIIESNLRFVVRVAKGYYREHADLSLGDLINEGNLGLIEAARRFDPERNIKFISYAVYWIRQSILKSITEKGRTIRISWRAERELFKINKVIEERGYEWPLSGEELGEICSYTGIALDELESLLNISRKPRSLDEKINEREESLSELIPKDAEPYEFYRKILGSELTDFINKLAPDYLSYEEIGIFRRRLGLGKVEPESFKDIGKAYGRPKQRVQQIYKKVFPKVVKHLSDYLNKNNHGFSHIPSGDN